METKEIKTIPFVFLLFCLMCFRFLNSSGGIVIHTLIHTVALLVLKVVGRLPEKKT